MTLRQKTRVLVVAAPKGGVGKTTLVMSLLVCAARSGLRTMGINMDGQESLEKWNGRRQRQKVKSQGLDIVDVGVERLNVHDYHRIADYSAYDLVIVDTLPGHSEAVSSIRGLCEMADLILVPTSSSSMDLDEVVPFMRDVVGADAKSWFVLNRVMRRTSDYHISKTALMKTGRLCPIDIPSLVGIPKQFMRGLTPTDVGEGGDVWFNSLWEFVRREMRIPGGVTAKVEEVA